MVITHYCLVNFKTNNVWPLIDVKILFMLIMLWIDFNQILYIHWYWHNLIKNHYNLFWVTTKTKIITVAGYDAMPAALLFIFIYLFIYFYFYYYYFFFFFFKSWGIVYIMLDDLATWSFQLNFAEEMSMFIRCILDRLILLSLFLFLLTVYTTGIPLGD